MTAEGNIEYWYCGGCGKYYGDAGATREITRADTVIAKLKPAGTARTLARTGDGSTVILWMALLLVSGGAVITATLVSRKRKRNR